MRRVVASSLFTLVAAVVVGLLPGPLTVTAQAVEPAPACFLDESGYLHCPRIYPPPPLLNPGVTSTLTIDERFALQEMQNQAMDTVMADHDLPEADRGAVYTWGRPEVMTELVSLIMQAAKTPIGQRNSTQQIVTRWLGKLVKAQAVIAAERAGEEYARWAGLNVSTYRQKVGGTQDALANFLSQDPQPRGNQIVDVFDTRPGGYCSSAARPVY